MADIPNVNELTTNGLTGAVFGTVSNKPTNKNKIVEALENAIKSSGVKFDEEVKIDILQPQRRSLGAETARQPKQNNELKATIGGKTILLGEVSKDNTKGAVQKIIARHIENQLENKGISFLSPEKGNKDITSETVKAKALEPADKINVFLKNINSIDAGKLPNIEIINPDKYDKGAFWSLIAKAKELDGYKILLLEAGKDINVKKITGREFQVLIPGSMLKDADKEGIKKINEQINQKIAEARKKPVEKEQTVTERFGDKADTVMRPTKYDADYAKWERLLERSGADVGTIGDGEFTVDKKNVVLSRNEKNQIIATVTWKMRFLGIQRETKFNLGDGLSVNEAVKKLGLESMVKEGSFKYVYNMIDGLDNETEKKDKVITLTGLEQFEKETAAFAEDVYCDDGEAPNKAKIEKARNYYFAHKGGWTRKSRTELRALSQGKSDSLIEAANKGEDGVPDLKKAYNSFKESIKNPVIQQYIDLFKHSPRYKNADSNEKVFRNLVSRVYSLSLITGLNDDAQEDYLLSILEYFNIEGQTAEDAKENSGEYVFNKANVKGEFNKAGKELEDELNTWMGIEGGKKKGVKKGAEKEGKVTGKEAGKTVDVDMTGKSLKKTVTVTKPIEKTFSDWEPEVIWNEAVKDTQIIPMYTNARKAAKGGLEKGLGGVPYSNGRVDIQDMELSLKSIKQIEKTNIYLLEVEVRGSNPMWLRSDHLGLKAADLFEKKAVKKSGSEARQERQAIQQWLSEKVKSFKKEDNDTKSGEWDGGLGGNAAKAFVNALQSKDQAVVDKAKGYIERILKGGLYATDSCKTELYKKLSQWKTTEDHPLKAWAEGVPGGTQKLEKPDRKKKPIIKKNKNIEKEPAESIIGKPVKLGGGFTLTMDKNGIIKVTGFPEGTKDKPAPTADKYAIYLGDPKNGIMLSEINNKGVSVRGMSITANLSKMAVGLKQ
ncbi:hypothetical protein ACFL57_02305 [Candidatus Margulisiibacteriota bacterium]